MFGGGFFWLVLLALGCLGAVWLAPWLRDRPKRGFVTWVLALGAAAVLSLGVLFAWGTFLYMGWGLSGTGSQAYVFFLAPVISFASYLTYVAGTWGAGSNVSANRQAIAPEPPRRPVPARSAAAYARKAEAAAALPDLFISYKRDERPEVLAIAARLEALKVRVWFDAEMRSGTTFDAEIDRNVRAAKCVLVCWSPGAVASDWVRGEATIGRERGVLAAALLKPCDLPAPFNLIHANDLRAGVGPANPEWLALLERIGGLLGRPGLASYERLAQDRAAYASWMADYPHDPLFEQVVAKLRAL